MPADAPAEMLRQQAEALALVLLAMPAPTLANADAWSSHASDKAFAALSDTRRTALAEVERAVSQRISKWERATVNEPAGPGRVAFASAAEEAEAILALVRDLAKEQAG